MKTLVLCIGFILAIIPSCEQQKATMIDQHLLGTWDEAVLNEDGEVSPAGIRRGGWSQLVFEANNKVTFNLPPTCGFGYSRKGDFTIDQDKQTMVFHFKEKIGYSNALEKGGAIDETETYQVIKAEPNVLVIELQEATEDLPSKTWAFLKKTE